MSQLPQQVAALLCLSLAAGCCLALGAGSVGLAADGLALTHLFSASEYQAGRTFLDPQGLAFDLFRSELYVADTGNSQVVVLSKTGLPLHRYQHRIRDASGDPIVGEPGALLPLPGGRMALTDRLSDRIDMLDYRGGLIQSIDVTAALGANERAHPGRLDQDAEGNLYVVEQSTSRVLVFDPRGKLLRSFGGPGKGTGRFQHIADVAVAQDGVVYVLDSTGEPTVTAFDPDGRWVFGFGRHANKPEAFHFPVAVAVDGAGRIWVADAFSHEVKAYTAKGAFLATFGGLGRGPGEFYFPSDVVAFADVLYVLEKGGGRVQAFHIGTTQSSPSPAAGKEEAQRSFSERMSELAGSSTPEGGEEEG